MMETLIGNTIVDEADINDVGLPFTLEGGTPEQRQSWVNRKARECLSTKCGENCNICRIDFYMKYSIS